MKQQLKHRIGIGTGMAFLFAGFSWTQLMTSAHVNSVVRLKEHLPAHRLRCGDVGLVVSAWLSTGDLLFEVEFHNPAAVRALLRAEQLEVIESEPLKQLLELRDRPRNRRRNPGDANQVEREL